MPGLVGIITSMPRGRAIAELQQMIGAMCHENFSVTELSLHEAQGVYVASVALRGSPAAIMALRNERDKATVMFSGEDFSVVGPTPASGTLANRYEEAPENFLRSLNGRFHGLIVDAQRREATIFVDRYGMHRLYYHQATEAFYFAAEAKAILAVRPELRQLDQRGLGELLINGCVLENRTLFQGIDVIPGASAWSFAPFSPDPKRARYFSQSEWDGQPEIDDETY